MAVFFFTAHEMGFTSHAQPQMAHILVMNSTSNIVVVQLELAQIHELQYKRDEEKLAIILISDLPRTLFHLF